MESFLILTIEHPFSYQEVSYFLKKGALKTANIREALNYKQYFLDIALRLSLGSYPRFELTFDLHRSTVVALVVLHDHQELEEG